MPAHVCITAACNITCYLRYFIMNPHKFGHQKTVYSSTAELTNVFSMDSGKWINNAPTVSGTAPQGGILSGRLVVLLISRLQSSPSDVVGWGRISETLTSVDQFGLTVGQVWDNSIYCTSLPSEKNRIATVFKKYIMFLNTSAVYVCVCIYTYIKSVLNGIYLCCFCSTKHIHTMTPFQYYSKKKKAWSTKHL